MKGHGFLVSALASAVLLPSVGTGPANATSILATSAGALGANDSINWGQLGDDTSRQPPLSSPQSVVSGLGLEAIVSSSGNELAPLPQPSSRVNCGYCIWDGNFAPGTIVLWDYGAGPQILVSFATPIRGAGAQIGSDGYGPFTAQIFAYAPNGDVLGSFTENGANTESYDNSAIFIGLLDSTSDIAAIQFDLTSAPPSPVGSEPPSNDFAIGTLELNTTAAATPEPSTWAMMLLGFAGLRFLGYRRTTKSGSTFAAASRG